MRAVTIKNVINTLACKRTSDKYLLSFKNNSDDKLFIFEINNESIKLSTKSEGTEESICIIFDDIYNCNLSGFFKPIKFERTQYDFSGSVSKVVNKQIRYDADLFVEVFRSIGEHALFTIKHQGRFTDFYYCNGKCITLDIDHTNREVNQRGYDLYALHKDFPHYEIVAIFANKVPCITIGYKNYTHKNASIAKVLGYKFNRYKSGFLVSDE